MRVAHIFLAALVATAAFGLVAEEAPAPTVAVPQPAASAPTASPLPAEPADPNDPEPPPAPPEPEPPREPDDLIYRADRVSYDPGTRTVKLEGNVVIERGGGRVFAPRGVLDRASGKLSVEGGVLAIQGLQVLLADAAVVDLRSSSADLVGATLFLKDRTAAGALATLTDRSAARTTGRNTLVLHGRSVRKLPEGGLAATDVSLTPCDCAGRPDYQVLSPEIRIQHERAELSRPTLDLLGLPIPLFVPISLPLGDRQTGMLAPKFGYGLTTGFGIVEPVFVTLGRSWDATIAPGWTTGARGAKASAETLAADPDFFARVGNRNVRGPRLDLELRGAPAVGTSLRLELDLLYDLDQGASVAAAPNAFGVPGNASGRGLGGVRGVLRASERTEGSVGTFALDGALATDAMVIADAQATVLERFLDSLRTDVGAWGRAGPAIVGAEATLLQDVRPNPNYPDRRLFGDEARRTFQRLPSVFVQLPAAPILGRLSLSGELSVARFMALRSVDPQEVQTGFGPTDLNAPGLLAAVPGADPNGLARAPATRLDVAPRLGLAIARGPLGALSATLGARADAWLMDGDAQRNRQRAYGLAGLRAESELSRPFGAFVHTIAPSVEVRVLTPAAGGGGPPLGDSTDAGGATYQAQPGSAQQGVAPGVPLRDAPATVSAGVPAARRPYDELDGAAPERGAGQAVFRIDQALWIAGAPGKPPTRALELTLAQDALLWAGGARGRLGEVWAAAAARLGPVTISAKATYDWSISDISAAAASAQLADARGDSLRASVQVLRSSAPEALRAGVDELFSTARLATAAGDLVGAATVGGSARLPFERVPLSVGYALERHLGSVYPGTADLTHRFGASIDTPCRCAGVSAALDLPFANGNLLPPSVRFVLDLKQLGSFGSP